MSYTVLARKYRSATFDQVVGQDHVAQTLKRAIESGRIAHAFLFCGTRGTGKTTMARILAKALNCEKADGPTTTPCGKCTTCQSIARGDDIDVIEIDAASNRGIDEVRKIIENSRLAPARSRFKVYIIDEVHAMTKDAFNALLKVLEEPPAHVKFILATTEPERVLQTILSRCQRYDFRNIPTREIAAHLAEICKTEGIQAQEDALLLVAKAGAGSMRDALSVLDRLLSLGEKTLSVEMVEQLLGLPRSQLLYDLADAIGRADVKAVLEQATAIISGGMSPDSLIAALSDHLRNLLIVRTCGIESHLVEVPGLSPRQLSEQAARFDPVHLTQDITILEELRRTMRHSQAGRAILDATLVRLALAEQFAPIPELLARSGGMAATDAAQKKNGSSAGAAAVEAEIGSAAADGPAPAQWEPPASMPAAIRDTILAQAPVEPAVVAPIGNAPAAATATDRGPSAGGAATGVSQTVASAAAAPAAPVVAPPQSLDFEDDDLPRPGKVWDSSGPSLAELLAQKTGGEAASFAPVAPGAMDAAAEFAADPSFANVEPVVAMDLSQVWGALLDQIKDQPGIFGILSGASLVGIEDELAVIRLSQSVAGMLRMFEKNGRREALCANLSKVLGRTVGVRFEVESAENSPASAPGGYGAGASGAGPSGASRAGGNMGPAPSPQGRPAPAPSRAAAAAPRPGPMPEPDTGGVRITPELVEQMRQEPLVAAVMDVFNATPKKVE